MEAAVDLLTGAPSRAVAAPATANAGALSNATLARDPRTARWPLAGNPPLIGALLLSYVYLVKVGGPRFMRDRKPYNLRRVILLYNATMVLLNAYFVVNFLSRSYLGGGYNVLCQGIRFDADPRTLELVSLCWWYLLVRIADFLDTVFFVLRKKDSHVSFLHVVHHVLVVFNGWFGLSYGPDGQVMFCICLNSFVHVIMYTYYFLSLLGPRVQKHLWWKRYLTQLQLAQFIVIFVHSTIPLFKDCGYPRPHTFIVLSESVLFFGMFVRFYRGAYNNKQPAKAA
ncbi:very long chain fatty acid elongase AAEL008004-like [Dermacentor andersoni]|uniref:very long chain fatty acid elongase AAEL008004-like n=1 Tax=Dermacentor andersoni TaxID=34620 RepID=UPI002155AA07|nr:elongation of very long chain fatty acids protein AAEL008004-like [Dermacentor andersoni]